ncbi:myb-like DNA-binding domain protein, partial [Ichthyophthirius multifiliis]
MEQQYGFKKTGKQIRERYINKLDPNIKKVAWTTEEDQIILDSFLEIGAKWSQISCKLNGRSENMVKNRFYSHIKRYYLGQVEIGNNNNDNNTNKNSKEIKDYSEDASENKNDKKSKNKNQSVEKSNQQDNTKLTVNVQNNLQKNRNFAVAP